MPPFSIRWAQTSDVPAVAALFNAYRQFYEQADDIALAEQFIAERMARADSIILVAEDVKGELLGFCQIYPSLCSVIAKPIGVLYDLFVRPDARSGGVGRALLQAAATCGQEQGFARLDLTTARTNLPAQALYESLGWRLDKVFLSYNLALHG